MEMLAAAEHEVFKQVGEPGLAGVFVLRPDVVPDVHGHDGRLVILMDDQGEAISEDEFLERNIDVLGVSYERQESKCKQRATHGTPLEEI
jgi:hypothetical protein